MSANVAISDPQHRRTASPVRAGRVPPAQTLTEEDLIETTFWSHSWKWISGDEGAGVAISFVIHAILLALLAIPIVHSMQTDQEYTTLVTADDDEQVLFDEEIDTEIPMPIPANAGGDPSAELVEMHFSDVGALSDIELKDMTNPAGEETAAGTDGVQGGRRVAQPSNAVQVGKFSVWPWPIKGSPNLKRPRLGEPGEFPVPGQNYLIVIRVQVPDGIRSLKITDFTGSVVGSDLYRQEIPEGCFQFTSSGQLIPIRLRPRIPVLNGTAELVLMVPGAGAFVEDVIKIHSETLGEEEELKLIFKPRN